MEDIYARAAEEDYAASSRPDVLGAPGEYSSASLAAGPAAAPAPTDLYETVRPFHADLDTADSDLDTDEEEEEEPEPDESALEAELEGVYVSAAASRKRKREQRAAVQRRKRNRTDHEFCYMCDYGQHSSQIQHTIYHQMLWNLMRSTYHHRSLRRWTRDVQDYYNATVRPIIQHPVGHPHYKRLRWTRRQIHEHIDKHMIDDTMQRTDSIMVIREAMTTLRDFHMFARDPKSGRGKLDFASTRLYMLLDARLSQSMRQLKKPTDTI